MRFTKCSAKGILAVLFLVTIAAGGGAVAEPAPVLSGAWAVGEDTETVYNFCGDGTFTEWRISYWGKCQPPEICREKIGCGRYTISMDAVSATIDLQYLQEEPCVALGRFTWDTGELCLHIGACGEARPELPCYYHMRASEWVDCACQAEGEVVEGEGEILEGEGEGEGEGEPPGTVCGCRGCGEKDAGMTGILGRAWSDWFLDGLCLIALGVASVNRDV